MFCISGQHAFPRISPIPEKFVQWHPIAVDDSRVDNAEI